MTCRSIVPLLLLTTTLFSNRATAAPQSKSPVPQKPTVTFGKRHGFYDAPFSVALSASNAMEIRYTLNGTIPSKSNGLQYTNPIEIRETTVLRTIATGAEGKDGPVQTQTYIFLQDVLRQSPDGKAPPNLPARWGRARVDYGMDARIVDAPANRDQMIPGLKSLPSFSLVMDPEDLFGETRGLYSNPEREGRSAERPASLELIYPGEQKGFQINCGIRIRGGVSSGGWNPKHAFRFFFRKDYGVSNLKYPVFGTNAAKTFDSFDCAVPRTTRGTWKTSPNAFSCAISSIAICNWPSANQRLVVISITYISTASIGVSTTPASVRKRPMRRPTLAEQRKTTMSSKRTVSAPIGERYSRSLRPMVMTERGVGCMRSRAAI